VLESRYFWKPGELVIHMEQGRGVHPEGGAHAEARNGELALRDEQRLMCGLGLLAVCFWALDALSVPWLPWDTLGVRGVWGGLMAAVGLGLPRLGREHRWVLRVVGGVVLPNVFLVVIVLRLGGAENPVFSWFGVLPVLALAVTRGNLRLSLFSALFTVACAAVVLAVGHSPAQYTALWLLLFFASGVVGVQCNAFLQQVRLARRRAEAQQLAAQEALVESQSRVLQAERLAQVGRLAAGVAHEVNNPLAFIQSNLRFLLEESQRPASEVDRAEHAEALRDTLQGVERIHQIVKDLTALSRSGELAGEVKPCELRPVIDTSVRLASVRLKSLVKVAVEMPREAPVVQADERRLGQVLLNLLLNAADAIEEAKVPGGQVAVKVEQGRERVGLVVEDNGPGIKPEHLQQLFTPFFTTKAPGKGTGLGLALSRQYVEAFGGTLRAENRPEGGARFVVELPLALPLAA
jgi:signal transduction histidine kinase